MESRDTPFEYIINQDFDVESDIILSQLDVSSENTNANSDFDLESDLVLSQFDMTQIIKNDEDLFECKFSQIPTESANMPESDDRFSVTNESDIKQLREASIPKNTRKNTNWGVNVWDAWGRWRNERTLLDGLKESTPYSLVPPLSVDLCAAELNFWMCRFIAEVSFDC